MIKMCLWGGRGRAPAQPPIREFLHGRLRLARLLCPVGQSAGLRNPSRDAPRVWRAAGTVLNGQPNATGARPLCLSTWDRTDGSKDRKRLVFPGGGPHSGPKPVVQVQGWMARTLDDRDMLA